MEYGRNNIDSTNVCIIQDAFTIDDLEVMAVR
jgi:hypothetical protein